MITRDNLSKRLLKLFFDTKNRIRGPERLSHLDLLQKRTEMEEKGIQHSIKKFEDELFCHMHLMMNDIIQKSRALTAIEEFFVSVYLNLLVNFRKALADNIRKFCLTAASREASPDEQETQKTLLLIAQYFQPTLYFCPLDTKKREKETPRLEEKQSSSLPILYQLDSRLRKEDADKIVHPGFSFAATEHLEQAFKKKQEAALNAEQHDYEVHFWRRTANLLKSAIVNNLALWKGEVSAAGSYSKIDGMPVPGSIAKLYSAIKSHNQNDPKDFINTLKIIAQARIDGAKNSKRYQFFDKLNQFSIFRKICQFRSPKVTALLNIIVNLDLNDKSRGKLDALEDDLAQIGLKELSRESANKGMQDFLVKELTNGCFIKF